MLVETFEVVRRPADARFEHRDPQARVAREHPAAHDRRDGKHDVHRELEGVELRVRVHEPMMGESSSAGVEAQRHVQLLGE